MASFRLPGYHWVSFGRVSSSRLPMRCCAAPRYRRKNQRKPAWARSYLCRVFLECPGLFSTWVSTPSGCVVLSDACLERRQGLPRVPVRERRGRGLPGGEDPAEARRASSTEGVPNRSSTQRRRGKRQITARLPLQRKSFGVERLTCFECEWRATFVIDRTEAIVTAVFIAVPHITEKFVQRHHQQKANRWSGARFSVSERARQSAQTTFFRRSEPCSDEQTGGRLSSRPHGLSVFLAERGRAHDLHP